MKTKKERKYSHANKCSHHNVIYRQWDMGAKCNIEKPKV